jgi:hypothetical protein
MFNWVKRIFCKRASYKELERELEKEKRSKEKWKLIAHTNDEFDESLDIDLDHLCSLNKEEQLEYLKDLVERRNAIHRRECP